jgi:hypothetical protein
MRGKTLRSVAAIKATGKKPIMLADIVTDVCQCIPIPLIQDFSNLQRQAAGVNMVSLVPIV